MTANILIMIFGTPELYTVDRQLQYQLKSPAKSADNKA